MKYILKTNLIFFLFINTINSNGQNKILITKLKIENIPKEINYNGRIKEAITWNDGLGKNLIITCETGAIKNSKSENEGFDYEIYVYHYLLSNKDPKLEWKIYDFVKDCNLDHQAEFIKNTLNITDLNNDKIGEIWIMYKTFCGGDVSPAEMKIIMYQGSQKFAMRGENKVKFSEKESYGGNYSFDKEFIKAPKVFKDYAIKLWNKNILQKWE